MDMIDSVWDCSEFCFHMCCLIILSPYFNFDCTSSFKI